MLYEKSKAKDIIHDRKFIEDTVVNTLHKMATIVGATLGPGGRCVLIERDGMSPLVTKDGVTVARSLGVDKAEANIVIEAAKEICLNTAKEAGDGTTTAIVLADSLSKHGHEFLKANPKYNPQRMINELQELNKTIIIPYLKNTAVKTTTPEQLLQVAAISANGDKAIAEVVVQAVMSAGEDGKVLVEEGQGDILRTENIEGYIVTSGLKDIGNIGSVFINDNANQQVKMDSGIIFLYDGSMNDLKVPAMIQEAIEDTDMMGSPIIVYAHDFSDVVKDRFAKTTKGGITVVPAKAPGSGLPNGVSIFLQDLAAYTGATVYNAGTVENLDEDEEAGFGRFKSARINMYESFILCDTESTRVDARVIELKSILSAAFSDKDRMHLRAHIAKLTGGVSTIWVGGASELEVREKKDRVQDAVEAVRSAIAEGVVPGGGLTHIRLARMMHQQMTFNPVAGILVNALYEPVRLLLSNCGEEPDPIMARMITMSETTSDSLVFDANKHEFVDAFEAGIIEPAKVCRVSISNALSVASLLMTLGGIVVVPRDSQLENQLAMSKQAFQDMMKGGIGE